MVYGKYLNSWGKTNHIKSKGRSKFYLVDSYWTAIKSSKHYGNGLFWYAIVPGLLDTYRELNVTHHIFCFEGFGSVNLPVSVLKNYLLTADKTYHENGSYHYHVRFRLDESKVCCYIWTGDRNTDVSIYLKLFNSIQSKVQKDLDGLIVEENYLEGKKNNRFESYFERNPHLRAKSIEIHGTKCKACGFSFHDFYGDFGSGYIEVHHLKPVSTLTTVESINPVTDMTVLCANCHRVVHRDFNNILSIGALKLIVSKNPCKKS